MAATDPMSAVRQYVNAFNNGDEEGMAASFAATGSILDGMPPHAWQGATAPKDWYRDVMAESARHGASDYLVELSDPLHNEVTSDHAYVVVPATMTFTLHGSPVRQAGAVLTAALSRFDDGWRLTAWAWTKGTRA